MMNIKVREEGKVMVTMSLSAKYGGVAARC
jgi:hypothetical protein